MEAVSGMHGNEGQIESLEALEQRAGELAAAHARLTAFAATLVHDLQQPMTTLTGFLTLLDKFAPEINEEHRSWLAGAIRGKDRIARTIDALYRDASYAELTLVAVSLDDVIAELQAELRTGAGALVIDTEGLPIVLGDPGFLAEVFVNLVQNAVRYRHDHTALRMRIRGRPDGDWWVVTVTDTGRGIDIDELDAVFERGARGRSSTGTHGTGTGLATVRSLMRHMGGDAWAEPHDGGARICLRARATAAD